MAVYGRPFCLDKVFHSMAWVRFSKLWFKNFWKLSEQASIFSSFRDIADIWGLAVPALQGD